MPVDKSSGQTSGRVLVWPFCFMLQYILLSRCINVVPKSWRHLLWKQLGHSVCMWGFHTLKSLCIEKHAQVCISVLSHTLLKLALIEPRVLLGFLTFNGLPRLLDHNTFTKLFNSCCIFTSFVQLLGCRLTCMFVVKSVVADVILTVQTNVKCFVYRFKKVSVFHWECNAVMF